MPENNILMQQENTIAEIKEISLEQRCALLYMKLMKKVLKK